ncbi:MAG: hypothetical protein P4L16_05630 [Chlamydiales bacterium]|nr:hypothetical protein [Chlamydiales bacterium]
MTINSIENNSSNTTTDNLKITDNTLSSVDKTIIAIAQEKSQESSPIITKAKPRLLNKIKYAAYLTGFITFLPLSIWVTIAYFIHKIFVGTNSLPTVVENKEFWLDVWEQIKSTDSLEPHAPIIGLNKEENDLFHTVKHYIETPEQFCEFLKGAHLCFDDGGKCYQTLCNETNKHTRISSHKSSNQQYSIRGDIVKEALFGTIIIDGKTCSWIQLEKDPANKNPICLADHFISYMKHLRTGKNIGPYGTSAHTDAQPLLLSEQLAVVS